jgi:hypothetical protein
VIGCREGQDLTFISGLQMKVGVRPSRDFCPDEGRVKTITFIRPSSTPITSSNRVVFHHDDVTMKVRDEGRVKTP